MCVYLLLSAITVGVYVYVNAIPLGVGDFLLKWDILLESACIPEPPMIRYSITTPMEQHVEEGSH